MPVMPDTPNPPGTLRLSGVLDIASAAELKQALLDALAAGKELRVSLAGVTEMDITAAQLLLAARRDATLSGIAFSLEGQLPQAVGTLLRETGLEQFLAQADTQ